MNQGESELSESDRLRAQEKFFTIDRGLADCTKCGYVYDPEKGDPEYPLPPGMAFSVGNRVDSVPCVCLFAYIGLYLF